MLSEGAKKYHLRCREFIETAATAPDMAQHVANFYTSLGGDVAFRMDEIVANGVRSLWLVPDGDIRSNVLLFFHGGGYISGSPETHANFAAHLAKKLGMRALLPDYRLVPAATFPSQIEDCLSVYRWLLEQVDSRRIVFAGESAGGSLVISTQLLALAQGLPIPAAGFAMSPWVDIENLGESHRSNIGRDLLVGDGEISDNNFKAYAGGHKNLHDALLNPLYADLSKIAPLMAQSGGDELLRDDAVLLVERAVNQAAIAEVQIVPEMQHMFQMCAGNMPEADAALDAGAAFLRRFVARD